MKWLLLSAISCIFVFSSCETDVDVIRPGHETTVVYGIIDINDLYHKIKITKTFIGNENAATMASIPDSSYFKYDEIEAYLHQINTAGEIVKTVKLDTAFTYEKEGGNFFSGRQMYYTNKTPFEIDSKNKLYLEIKNHKLGTTVSSIINVVNKFRILEPYKDAFGSNNITFATNVVARVKWLTDLYGVSYYSRIRFNYLEVVNNDTSEKHLDWFIKQVNKANESEEFTTYIPSDFYTICLQEIENKAEVTRYIGSKSDSINCITAEVTAVDEHFKLYSELNSQEENSYNELPQYSNINNGIGLFSSRNTSYSPVLRLTSSSITELIEGKTSILNFKPRNF